MSCSSLYPSWYIQNSFNMAKNLDDAALTAFRQGNERVFTEIYDKYRRKIYVFSFNILQNKEEAEDITAETLAQLWQERANFYDEKYINNFLYKVAKNKCINLLKARKTEGKTLRHADQEWLEETIKDEDSTHFQNMITAELSDQLWMEQVKKEIDQLSPRRKEIFRLHFLEGWPVDEIADHLHLSPGTVYKTIEQAREILKAQIRKKGYELILKAFWLILLLS